MPLLFLAMTVSVRAEPLFSAPSLLFDTGGTPNSVAIADLNGDGRPDLAIANSGTLYSGAPGTVTVLYGNGDGTFGTKTDFGTGTNPQSVAIADLNGDGFPDLVTSNGAYNAVSVLLGNGDGTFAAKSDFGPGIGAWSVAIADMNGDSFRDLVTERSVFLGNGDGTFGARNDFNGGNAVAIGDLNGDGRLDLVTNGGYDPDTDDYVGVGSALLGNGDGTFGAPIGFETGLNPWSIAISDFNGDGRPDVAVANYGHTPDYYGTVSVLLGNGDGTLGAQRLYGTGANPSAVAVADLNGDGRADLVTANLGDDRDFDSNTVSVFLGNGDGTFRSATELVVGEDPCAIAIADLDANGTQDLVTSNWVANTVSVLLGNGDGTFGARYYGVGGGPFALAVGDLNLDGHLDLATTNFGSSPTPVGTVSVLLGNGNGTFRNGNSIGIGTPRGSLAIADLNSDGRPDLAMTINGGFNGAGWVSIMLGNGNGTFKPITNYPSGSSSTALAIGDLNADGRPDVVTANFYPSTVAVLLGNGDGTLGARTEFPTGLNPVSVATGDLNADGRPDLVTYNTYYPQTVSVLMGNGDGTFGARTDIAAGGSGGSNSRSVAIVDVDADGRPDLVTSAFVMLGNGDGTLGARINLPMGGSSAAIADFDADGRLDLAVTQSYLWTGVWVLLGNGDGTFMVKSVFGAGRYPASLMAADLNEDRRPDLAVADYSSSTVSALLNLNRSIQRRERHYPAAPRGGADGLMSVSGPFSTDAAAGAARRPGRIALVIRGATPQAATGGRLPIEFALGDGSAARLELLDVAGRALASRQVGAFGPGRHTLDLSPGRALSPGIYFLRLTQGGREARARVAVLR